MERFISNDVFEHKLESGKHELLVVVVIECVNEDAVIALLPMETGVAS